MITNIVPEYRRGFVARLAASNKSRVVFFCQRELQGINHSVVSEDDFPGVIRYVPHVSLGANKLTWQFLPFFKLLVDFDVLVFTGNPRVVSSVALSVIARLFRKKIIVWGHVRTAGSDGWSRRLRLYWWFMFPTALTYTEQEILELENCGYRGRVISINNGVDYHLITENFSAIGLTIDPLKRLEACRILTCCRLIDKNKIGELIDAVGDVVPEFDGLRCDIIGDGPLRSLFAEKVKQLGLENIIFFHGAIYDESQLAPLFNSATFLVHPGAIGLSALHSLCYSVPIVTHDNPREHMPEFSVLRDSENSVLYASGACLADVLRQILSIDQAKYIQLVSTSSQMVRERYNARVMARRFLESAE